VPADFVVLERPETFVDKATVLAAIDRPAVCLLDALPREMHRGELQPYARPGHIPGSVNAPYGDLVDSTTHRYLTPHALRRVLGERPTTEGQSVIAYCGHALAASSAAFALGLVGNDNVSIYDGSLAEWSADESLPMVQGD
jgi:thiosulfate/3-mercaptopyruvate sulfurtransferase